MLISEDQIQELYEINDDPKRKEFLDDLFSFMQKRGTPINRLPIMAKSVLDLYELYNLVIARGGLVDVINKKLWQEIIKGLHLPSSITSAAFTLRTQYMKYLYPYECEKKNLSTPAELQAAIDGNRREGRRSSYGQYEAMHNQMQMPQIGRQSLPGGMQQISPLALVTHAANNQQAQAAAAAAAAHHRLMAPSFGQVPNLVTQEIEQRMIEYLKLIQVKKEQNAISNGSAALGLSPHHQQHQQQQQQQRPRSPSPEISTREALNALEMSRVALWQMYHNNTSPPASVNTSPQGGGTVNSGGSNDVSEAQRSEVLNLSESPPNLNANKRERELEPSPAINENDDFHHQPPPAKRAGFPASFYLPPGMSEMAAAAAAANYHYKGSHHDSDAEVDEENDDGEQNITVNSSRGDPNEAQHLSGSSLRAPRHHGSNSSVHNDKSDDSAIENSPSTSAASAGNGNISPVSTKKIHLTKQTQPHNKTSNTNTVAASCSDNITIANSTSLGPFEALNLLSGMQFRVTRNGTNSKGEPELAVNLELNGIKYSGVLISNISNLATVTATSLETMTPLTTVSTVDDNSFSNKNINNSQNNENNSTTSCSQKTDNLSHISTNINNNSKEANNDLVVSMDAIEDTSELTVRDVETPSNTSMTTAPTITATANAVIANGPNSSTNSLKDALITP